MLRSVALLFAGCSAALATVPLAAAGASGVTVPPAFTIVTIAAVPGAREIAALPNGDLLVGTTGREVYLVPSSEAGTAGPPLVFATAPDDIAAGVAFSARRREIYVATERAVYSVPYVNGQRSAGTLRQIARVRTGPVAPHSDGDVHSTTSVTFSDTTDTLYVAVGSSCNACAETDSTRASIFQMSPTGAHVLKRATRIRNAIALAVQPESGALWAGDAGQDNLPFGHPYEFLDDVSSHAGFADYGWPECEENQTPYVRGARCTGVVAPLVVLPAYSTIVGAAFYPEKPAGAFAFPAVYRGALFAAAHGSWHRAAGGGYAALPQVVSIAMRNGRPATPVDWNDPRTQWRAFVGGFQVAGTRERIGRPTGLAVGTQGSLFVADDGAGVIYRVRPKL
jgi:glucose/arabinose dehydrogenase